MISQLVLDRAVAVGLGALQAWDRVSPPSPPSEEPLAPLPFFLPPKQDAHSASPESDASKTQKSAARPARWGQRRASGPGYGPPPKNTVASEQLVLQWAERGAVPQGRLAQAEPGMPAGIELYGVGGLGIGLLDGDRLVSVGGVPASERAAVVGEVLSARARGAPEIVASLVRRTKRGPVPFTVIVRQPYLAESSGPVAAPRN